MLLFVFVICSYLAGISFGVTCLQDADTCWILKMGQVINANGAIPKEDPFSFNTKKEDGKPHVFYQWLSEVAFYNAYNCAQQFKPKPDAPVPPPIDGSAFGYNAEERKSPFIIPLPDNDPNLKGPMLLGAFLCAGAFLAFPLMIFLKAPARPAWILVLILVAAQASSFHFYLRPELFSAFMFALELFVLQRVRLKTLKDQNASVSWLSIITICGIMFLWCNLHCGFVLGLIVLFLFAATQSLISQDYKSKLNLWLMFGLGTLSTAINPWGFELWEYLLKLFTSPVGAKVEELQALSLSELFGFTYGLYFAFALATLTILIFCLYKLKDKKPFPTMLFSCVVVAMVLVMGIGARRLIPFACILAVCELPILLSISQEINSDDTAFRHKWFAPAAALMVFVATIFGTWWESGLFKLQLPQSSYGFPAPYEAIRYLQFPINNAGEFEKIRGNMLNDPQFGDMIIWHIGTKVFIDTRFDIYQDKIVFDFLTMANCQPGYEKLLDQYKIAWIFLPPHTQLAQFALAHPEKWSVVYKDDTAIIARCQPSRDLNVPQ